MPEFMLHHTHEPDQCEAMFGAYAAYDTPLKGNDRTFFCTCPTGDHGGFIQVEADDEEAALALLPEVERPTTTVYAGETMSLDI